jgi:hypothetical protein
VCLQAETSQEVSAMQETRRMEEVNDSGLEMLTFVIFFEIAFIFVCFIMFFNYVCCLIRCVFQ